MPWFATWFVSTWKQTARGAVIHDYLYSMKGRERYGYTRKQADGIFKEVLGVMGHRRRWFAWVGLRLFGGLAWRGHEKKAEAASS